MEGDAFWESVGGFGELMSLKVVHVLGVYEGGMFWKVSRGGHWICWMNLSPSNILHVTAPI